VVIPPVRVNLSNEVTGAQQETIDLSAVRGHGKCHQAKVPREIAATQSIS
jgi:hypothetical protein